jgi:metal transporter CNNM
MTYAIIIILIALSALFSGLTLGFFSLKKDDLERKAELGDKRAQKVFSVRKNGTLLLCTLLTGNAAVNASISILLNSIVSGVLAGVMATVLIVIFGEITPQAVFSRHGLRFGAKFVWLTKFFIILFFPLCWPLAKVLNALLGHEMPTVYSKKELVKIIEEHEDLPQSDLDADEEKILKGGLSFSDKKVADIMTPRAHIAALPAGKKINKKNMAEITASGHSRIPVYEKTLDAVVGILYLKDLVRGRAFNTSVGAAARKNIIFVDPNKPLDELLNDFRRTRNHLFVVKNKLDRVVGIVTIEDVIEEILGAEIIDEFDYREKKLLQQKQERY